MERGETESGGDDSKSDVADWTCHWAVRQGPQGSLYWSTTDYRHAQSDHVDVKQQTDTHTDTLQPHRIAPATLVRPLKTPTGAGNAYAGAWAAACAYYRNLQHSQTDSTLGVPKHWPPEVAAAAVASAIGAVVCEYEHLPTEWDLSLRERLREAHADVVTKMVQFEETIIQQ
jgi:sugar/nucleoside kinase (ribokinase family)